MKRTFLVVILTGLCLTSIAQDNTSSTNVNRYTPSPDFPGSVVIDYGFSYFDNNSAIMDVKPGKSPTLNIYYMYPFRLGASRFSFNVGAGIGSEKYSFNAPVTFVDDAGVTLVDSLKNLSFFNNTSGYNKTQVVVNYFDIPLEFRVHLRKNDHKRSWYLAVGGKIGVRLAAKTKVLYKEFDTDKKIKDLYNYNISTFRYGASARVGIGPFSIWGYYGLNPFFIENKTSGIKNPNTFSLGISLSTF
jgi:hypothetical protein